MLLATGCRHAPTLTLQRDHSWLWRWWWRWWLWWWWWSGGGYKHHNHNGIWISFISFPWVASWLISIWGVTITSSPSQKKRLHVSETPQGRDYHMYPNFLLVEGLSMPPLLSGKKRSDQIWLKPQKAVNLGRRLHRRMGCSTLISGSGFQRTTNPFLFIKTTEHPSTFKNMM